MEEAIERGYTHVIRLQEFQNEPYCLEMSLLPAGPSVSLRIRKYMACKDIHNRGVPIVTQPEMIFKNFSTSLGFRVQRFFQSIFPPQPKLKDRTIISLINQRDFMFFRHHRYIFKKKNESFKLDSSAKESEEQKRERIIEENVKVNTQEIGPRLVLQLRKFYSGVFDTVDAEYEFFYRGDYYVKRNNYFL
jgi:ribosome production factor 1